MPELVKPRALVPGSIVDIVAPSGAVDQGRLQRGCQELQRLGYEPRSDSVVLAHDAYFAGPSEKRRASFKAALANKESRAVVAARGGYGAIHLLAGLEDEAFRGCKLFVGFSDVTVLQVFLWQKLRWVTFYGPMVAAGFNSGADRVSGYGGESFRRAVTQTAGGWSLELEGQTIAPGETEGVLLGGCLTLLETLLGTPWDLDTRGTILLVEDRWMRPYQIDRSLMHLKLAGKLDGVHGIVLGDFPDCDLAGAEGPSVREICERILAPLGIPIVYGAPFGHTYRPMLTLPLGVRVRLEAQGSGMLQILEPAVSS